MRGYNSSFFGARSIPATPKSPLCGGKAIGSGTYGCVFLPALRCAFAGAPTPNTVSKLLPTEEADKEYRETTVVRAAAGTLNPLEQDLMIVPAPPCMAVPLSVADLEDYREKCPNFPPNPNAVLSTMRLLNQVNGGMTVYDLNLLVIDDAGFAQTTTALLNLMHAMRDMNLRGVIHGDLKSYNIVFRADDGKARAIDWGLCRSVHDEYTGSFWRTFSVPIVMYNSVPSLYFYSYFVHARPSSATAFNWIRMDIVDWAVRALQRHANENCGHLRTLDRMFAACFGALDKLGYAVKLRRFRTANGAFVEPLEFADGTRLSLHGTLVLVAHGVAFMTSVLGPGDSTLSDIMRRFFILVDLVLRVNVDVFGIMSCYFDLWNSSNPARTQPGIPNPERGKNVLARLAPYVLDPKYAVAPYNFTQVVMDMRDIAAGTPFTAPPPDFDVTDIAKLPSMQPFDAPQIQALERTLDAANLRAFSAEPYINQFRAEQNLDALALTVDEQAVAVRTAGARLLAASSAPLDQSGKRADLLLPQQPAKRT